VWGTDTPKDRDEVKRREVLFISDCVYYEEINRDLKRIFVYECRCNERLNAKVEGSTRLVALGCNTPLVVYFQTNIKR
jgi:hypothetical protein